MTLGDTMRIQTYLLLTPKTVETKRARRMEPGSEDLALNAGMISGNYPQTDMDDAGISFKRFISSQGIHFRQFVIWGDVN